MPVLILRIASAAPEKARTFYKVPLELGQALSRIIKSQPSHFNAKMPGLSVYQPLKSMAGNRSRKKNSVTVFIMPYFFITK